MPIPQKRTRRSAQPQPVPATPPVKPAKPLAHRHRTPPPVPDEILLADFENYLKYVSCQLVNKYGLREEEKDELQQQARLRLWRCPQGKRREPVYIKVVIMNAMRTELARILKLKNKMVAIDPHWHLDLDPEATSKDPIDTLEADVHLEADAITRDREKQANDLLALCTPEEQLVLRLHVCPPPGERAIRDMRTLSKRSMVRESRLPGVIASAMRKMREAAGVVAP